MGAKPKEEVTLDQANEIHELAGQGYGSNAIGKMVGVNSSAVKQVLQGTRVNYSTKLSARQRQALLNQAFRPCQW